MQLTENDTLAAEIGELLLARGARMATAETTAGGLISARLLSVPGASHWFDCGIVAYTGNSKAESLGVDAELINANGSVSPVTVEAMAQALRAKASVDYCVAESGMAGPQTGRRSPKPAGSVAIAVATPAGTTSQEFQFKGTRIQVMEQIAEQSLTLLREAITANS